MPGQGLVDRVVNDLEDHVVEAGTVIGIPDVHPGPLAHGVKALEDLDLSGVVDILELGGIVA